MPTKIPHPRVTRHAPPRRRSTKRGKKMPKGARRWKTQQWSWTRNDKTNSKDVKNRRAKRIKQYIHTKREWRTAANKAAVIVRNRKGTLGSPKHQMLRTKASKQDIILLATDRIRKTAYCRFQNRCNTKAYNIES